MPLRGANSECPRRSSSPQPFEIMLNLSLAIICQPQPIGCKSEVTIVSSSQGCRWSIYSHHLLVAIVAQSRRHHSCGLVLAITIFKLWLLLSFTTSCLLPWSSIYILSLQFKFIDMTSTFVGQSLSFLVS
jgi:hypothetical protein